MCWEVYKKNCIGDKKRKGKEGKRRKRWNKGTKDGEKMGNVKKSNDMRGNEVLR